MFTIVAIKISLTLYLANSRIGRENLTPAEKTRHSVTPLKNIKSHTSAPTPRLASMYNKLVYNLLL